jgi:uncharacterized membrane protein
MTAPHLAENYLLKRVAIVVGSIVAVYLVNLIVGRVWGAVSPLADAAAGYALGIVTKHYWS